jgi:hypothetical protein
MAGRKPGLKRLTPTGYRVTMPHRLVRDPHFSSLLEEYGRSFMGKDLPEDPTVAKVLAMARGTTEILYRLHTHPSKLEVSDAPSWEEFLKNARMVYHKAPPPGKRGRKLLLVML